LLYIQQKLDSFKETEKNALSVPFNNIVITIKDLQITTDTHKKEQLGKYLLPYDYDPTAKCPIFDRFINEVLPEKLYQQIIFEFIGWSLIPTYQMKLEKGQEQNLPAKTGCGLTL
jgi:putative DNA primase/helicase